MPLITSLVSRIVFNSRGDETIEVDIITDDKYIGRASAPSGASVGKHEVQSFPHNEPQRAIQVLNSNSNKFIGAEASKPRTIFEIIRTIDSTPSYSIMGGSMAYALSIAVCPVGATNIVQALEMNFLVHRELRKMLEIEDKNFTNGRGDEGAWAPRVNNDKALDLAERSIENSGFEIGRDVALGIDFASSSLWNSDNKCYEYKRQGLSRDTNEQIEFVNSLVQKYNLMYIEDPVHEEDFESMAEITRRNRRCIVAGDDMLVTNKERVIEASKYGACSGAILKVNQAGTLYDALLFVEECKRKSLKIITSHRSGESVDSHLSHIAIATQSKMIKCGIVGGERVAKLNELIRLTEYDLIDGMADLSS
jgi:enolase